MSDFQHSSWQDASGKRGGAAPGSASLWLVGQVFFPVNSAALDTDDEATLRQLASAYGPLLLGKAVRFRCVGGADWRGSEGSNKSLGAKRAQTVNTALANAFQRMSLFSADKPESRGESGARHTVNPVAMASDRCVDILANATIAMPAAVAPDPHLAIRSAIINEHHIVERAAWGQFKPVVSGLVADWDYDSIVIHHAGNQGAKNPREIENKHMLKNGWEDVGYHYLIHPDGTIYEGRSILFKGSHVLNANTHKIGVLMMGDYDQQWWDADDTLTQQHLNTLRSLITTLKKKFGSVKYLGGHIEFAEAHGDERSCPGNLLIAELDGLRTEFGLAKP